MNFEKIVYTYVKPFIEECIKDDTVCLIVDFETFLRLTNLSNVTVLDYEYKFQHRHQTNIADAIYQYKGRNILVFCLKSNTFLYTFCKAGNKEMLSKIESVDFNVLGD